MSNFHISNRDVSELIRRQLEDRGWSIRKCVALYNERRSMDPELQKLPALNKDFLLRVKNNKFEVANKRVAKLCDFLGVEFDSTVIQTRTLFESEFRRVELLVAQNPRLTSQVSKLLNTVVDFAENSYREVL